MDEQIDIPTIKGLDKTILDKAIPVPPTNRVG